MTDETTAARSSKRSGPGRPSNAEKAADLAGQIEQTLNGLADLLEPPEGVDVETIAGRLRADARTIAEYAAGLADRHAPAAGAVKRLLVASGAIRAFGPIVGMLLGRAFSRRGDDTEPEDDEDTGMPMTHEAPLIHRRIVDQPQA